MNIKLTSATEFFYLLAHSGKKERIKTLYATIFIIQAELNPLFYLMLKFWL